MISQYSNLSEVPQQQLSLCLPSFYSLLRIHDLVRFILATIIAETTPHMAQGFPECSQNSTFRGSIQDEKGVISRHVAAALP